VADDVTKLQIPILILFISGKWNCIVGEEMGIKDFKRKKLRILGSVELNKMLLSNILFSHGIYVCTCMPKYTLRGQ
jgi:hypothetical protein